MDNRIKITRTQQSRISEVDFANIPFGKVFADHMFVADFDGKQWKNFEIRPLERIPFHPATMAWHYGQAIFEGMKAAISDDGTPLLFRPHDHGNRLNASASRMCMPEFPVDLFVEALSQLISIDRNWIPREEDSALYIRPVMMATDEFVGVRSSDTFKLMIMNLPSGPYYSKPVSLLVEEKYVRAVDGGVGEAKAAGNYGASLYPTKLAKDKGYDQVMWMDAHEFKYVQEVGTMNIFFVLKDKVLTPNLSGTILKGITRDSLITLMKEKNYRVEERPVSMEEIAEAHRKGELIEVFGAGTAAVVANVNRIGYKGQDLMFDDSNWSLSRELKSEINGIRKGRITDRHGWILPVVIEEPATVA
ncbi:MAG TPA: branched-chain amino acid aminotransferase [Saprospiraceae bacterium]|nr:branched-chain amino acid aminotransferase [Saprospiraceae bacterium]